MYMPNQDKTGPQGKGPMTGRKCGACTSPSDNNEPKKYEYCQGRGLGKGLGRGRGNCVMNTDSNNN